MVSDTMSIKTDGFWLLMTDDFAENSSYKRISHKPE